MKLKVMALATAAILLICCFAAILARVTSSSMPMREGERDGSVIVADRVGVQDSSSIESIEGGEEETRVQGGPDLSSDAENSEPDILISSDNVGFEEPGSVFVIVDDGTSSHNPIDGESCDDGQDSQYGEDNREQSSGQEGSSQGGLVDIDGDRSIEITHE